MRARHPLRGTLRIARRELRWYLLTPWTYAVAAAVLALTGIIFVVVADGSREASLRFWFPNLAFVLLVSVPIVTSRLVAEERHTAHLDVLLSRPLTPAALVMGKWLAATGFLLALLLPTGLYTVFLAVWGRPDWPPMIASYIGVILLVALFSAVGTMASTLTPTAVTAGLCAFALLTGVQLAGAIPGFQAVSFQPHLDGFSLGTLALDDVVYFVSGTAACLAVAAASQVIRLRPIDRVRALIAPAGVLAAALALTILPVTVDARADLTASHRYSLSDPSKEVLHNIHVPVSVTVFAPSGTGQEADARILLADYTHENPRIETRVVDAARAPGEATRLGASDAGDAVVEVGERREVVSPLTEQGLTSALQRLARRRPQTACAVSGHGERELDDTSPAGWDLARQTIEANGIATRRLDLTVARTVPSQCTVVLLIGPTGALLPSEVKMLSDYLASDGRMLVAREPDGSDLDALIEPWGLHLTGGLVVDPERGAADDPTALLVNRFPAAAPAVTRVSGLLLVTAGGVTTMGTQTTGLTVTALAQSSSGSWLALDPASVSSPGSGDPRGPITLAAQADRSTVTSSGESRLSTGGPSIVRTRLFVVADADWASNAFVGQLDNRRLLANAMNWLAGEDDLVAIEGENPDLRRLELTSKRRTVMDITTVGGIPAAVLLTGGALWMVRRRR